MSYRVIHACRISGRNYETGDTVPDDVMLPHEAARLVHFGFIREADEYELKSAEVDAIYITLINKDSETDEAVNLETGDIQAIFNALQLGANEAVQYIKDGFIRSRDALEVLNRIDSRKSVRQAIKARLEEVD